MLLEITGTAAVERAAVLAARLRSSPPAGVVDASAAYETVAVYFDPCACDSTQLSSTLLRAAAENVSVGTASRASHVIPVVYDGEDLDTVAERTGLTRARIAELHSSVEYTVLAVGFVPGFAYLGELDKQLHIPRRDTPRPRVPAGAVAIAGQHTAVYPLITPGGWHLIGRTSVRMFDPARTPPALPALLAAGDRVRFTAE
jgi:KipI family sensor histidine kinase inhibitor